MEIIQFEGLDKSGKATQTQMLLERMTQEGYKVAVSEFHRYDTPTGELVGKWLRGQWDVDQKTIELIMAADKQAQQAYFDKLEKDGYDYLILDRYSGSQYVYGPISLKREGMGGSKAEAWVGQLLRHLRDPDFTILLDIPATVSMSRKGKHNDGKNDRYESDRVFLEAVRNRYIQIVSTVFDKAIIVDGLKSPEEVHADVWKALAHML